MVESHDLILDVIQKRLVSLSVLCGTIRSSGKVQLQGSRCTTIKYSTVFDMMYDVTEILRFVCFRFFFKLKHNRCPLRDFENFNIFSREMLQHERNQHCSHCLVSVYFRSTGCSFQNNNTTFSVLQPYRPKLEEHFVLYLHFFVQCAVPL